ncbi:ABC-type Na+ transport system ATPase subunit NatA, partial [Kitasatospora sp. GP82]|nr:ABC-type Na+ transport system ATPase subunit NatA [Kitasatospora sp. GP82]
KRVRALTSMVLGGERGLYGRLTALDNLHFFAKLSGLSRAEVKQSGRRIDRLGASHMRSRT